MNVTPAASIPKPSDDALWEAPLEPELAPLEEVDPDEDPDPVAPAEPPVGDATPPVIVVVPLMSAQA